MTTQVSLSPATFLATLTAVADEIRQDAPARDREQRYPVEQIQRLRDINFWALTVPTEYGGLGFGPESLIQAIITLSAADASLGQLPQNHYSSIERLLRFGSARQKEYYLTRVGSGAIFGNATAEAGERRPGKSQTSVVERDGRLLLSGRKVYCTGSLFADFISVLARNEAGEQVTVVVRPDDEGVHIHDSWSSFGQRTTGSGTTEFARVEVGPLQVLPRTPDPSAAYRASSLGQLIHAAIDVGLAEGALAEAVSLARSVHGGRGSGAPEFRDDALGVAHLGELKITTHASRRLVESAARLLGSLDDRAELRSVLDVFYEVVQAKVVSTRAALSVTAGLFDVGGSSSTRPRLGLDRYWRDARTHTLHDAARWKPYALGRWLIDNEVADAWSLAKPLHDLAELENFEDHPVEFYGSAT